MSTDPKRPDSPRVLFVQHSANHGGAPRSLLQIVQEYEKEFGPQTVLFLRDGPVIAEYAGLSSSVIHGNHLLPFHGSEVSGMNWKVVLRNLWGLLGVPWAYFRYLRGWDVVYLNSSALCFYGLMVRWFSHRTRLICHIREPLLHNIWGTTIRMVLRHSVDQFIAISTNELVNLQLPDRPGEVAYNYVDSSRYAPQKGKSLHAADPAVADDALVVGYFARLDIKNGIADFMALAKRFESEPGWAFCIYGHTGKASRDVMELLADLPANVHVYPMVSEVAQNLGDLDVVVVPFKSPHFSRSVIEAAMLGVPSVIYDIVSVNETVEDGLTGFVVPLDDVAAMGDRLAELRADPARLEALSAAARRHALEHFSERNYQKIRDAINA